MSACQQLRRLTSRFGCARWLHLRLVASYFIWRTQSLWALTLLKLLGKFWNWLNFRSIYALSSFESLHSDLVCNCSGEFQLPVWTHLHWQIVRVLGIAYLFCFGSVTHKSRLIKFFCHTVMNFLAFIWLNRVSTRKQSNVILIVFRYILYLHWRFRYYCQLIFACCLSMVLCYRVLFCRFFCFFSDWFLNFWTILFFLLYLNKIKFRQII